MSSEKLFNEVVNSGLCCSCGTCVSACPKDGLAIPLGEVGPESVSSDCTDECTICYDVCTGRDLPYSEMEEMIFGRKRTHDQAELRGLDVTSLWRRAGSWRPKNARASIPADRRVALRGTICRHR